MAEVVSELKVQLHSDGNLHVEYPEDVLRAYGMLEFAKDVIRMNEAEKKKGRMLQIPAFAAPPLPGHNGTRLPPG